MSTHRQVEVVQINTYPIKSCKGLSLTHGYIGDYGLEYDRKYMLVDRENGFVSLRTYPALSQITPVITSGVLACEIDNKRVPIDESSSSAEPFKAKIWNDEVMVQEVDPSFSVIISDYINMDVRMVQMFDPTIGRMKDVAKLKTEVPLSFVDGYPVHIVNEASLKDLSQKVDFGVSSMRFRPNLVIRGLDAFEEENLSSVETVNFRIDIVKPTVRCAVPNVDPITGDRGKEPMKTLATYKQRQNKIEFGVYGIVTKKGEVHVNEHLSLFFN